MRQGKINILYDLVDSVEELIAALPDPSSYRPLDTIKKWMLTTSIVGALTLPEW